VVHKCRVVMALRVTTAYAICYALTAATTLDLFQTILRIATIILVMVVAALKLTTLESLALMAMLATPPPAAILWPLALAILPLKGEVKRRGRWCRVEERGPITFLSDDGPKTSREGS